MAETGQEQALQRIRDKEKLKKVRTQRENLARTRSLMREESKN